MSDSPAPLTPVEVSHLLRAAGDAIAAEVGAMPRHVATFRPAPGEWCALEVVGHLIEAEQRGFAGRIRLILSHRDSEPLRLQGWDQDEVARARHDHERDPGAVLAEFATLRAASAALVAGLGAADLGRAGDHPKVGRLTVGDLLHEWVHHDRNHFRQILAGVQALVWPNMGNARRFSGP
jgi:hypothetical protein